MPGRGEDRFAVRRRGRTLLHRSEPARGAQSETFGSPHSFTVGRLELQGTDRRHHALGAEAMCRGLIRSCVQIWCDGFRCAAPIYGFTAIWYRCRMCAAQRNPSIFRPISNADQYETSTGENPERMFVFRGRSTFFPMRHGCKDPGAGNG